jgi:hypothetical protein
MRYLRGLIGRERLPIQIHTRGACDQKDKKKKETVEDGEDERRQRR